MKRLSAVVISALVLTAGTAFAARSSAGVCFDSCASKRPTAADQKNYQDCLKPHVQQMKPKVAGLKKQTREARDAAWKEIHQAREATASRCITSSLKAWNECLKKCQ
jgi:hypothetical protein